MYRPTTVLNVTALSWNLVGEGSVSEHSQVAAVCLQTDLEVGMPQVQIDPISTAAGQLQPPEILTLLVT